MRFPGIRPGLRAALALVSAILAAPVASAQDQPVAPVRPVTDDYFGTKVVDNYRYMEDLGNAPQPTRLHPGAVPR